MKFELVLQETKDFLASHPNGVVEVLGPTASGKTDFSVRLALTLGNSEIISVDSRQVYRGVDVSAAKITEDEMQGVPHHGIDLVSPEEDFNVFQFQQYAFEKIEDIQSREKVAMLCGGTMLWLDAVSENYVFSEKGTKSTQKLPPRFPVLKWGLEWDREKLYERINKRACQQFESGLIEETKQVLSLYKNITQSAFTSFGYQEIESYLKGDLSYEEALNLNQQRNRNYAKRQLTWWRGRSDVRWISLN